MWNFFRRVARLTKRPPGRRDRGRASWPWPPGRLQVERLEDRLSPGGLFGSALDASVEQLALFWQGPEGLAASQRPQDAGSNDSTAAPVVSSTDLDSLGGAAPLPIPGGFANPTGRPFIHFNFPGPADASPPFGNDPSTITDFNGFIGVANVRGTGTGTDSTGATSTLYFTVDVRFMTGLYQGVDGNLHQATFAEV
jgi:hypothetical protein